MRAATGAAMIGSRRRAASWPRWAGGCAAAAALILAGAVAAQAPQAPTQLQPPAAPPAQVDPGTRPGFIDAFRHWIQGSVPNWNDGIKGAGDVAKDAANTAGTVTRDPAGAVAGFLGTGVWDEEGSCA